MPSLQPVRPVTVFQAVFDQLSTLLTSDAFAAGDRLPAERELAEQLHVSRPPVREALKALGALGLVEVRGRSTYVKGSQRTGEPALVLSLEKVELLEIHDFREAVETQIAALAAERATAEDVQALEQAVISQHDTLPAALASAAADHQFYRMLARAAHSQLLLDAHVQIHEHALGQAHLQAAERQAQDVHGARNRSLDAHRRIVAAIRQGDAAKARRLMQDHLTRLRQSIVVGSFALPSPAVKPASDRPTRRNPTPVGVDVE